MILNEWLTVASYTTIIQAADFVAGTNFVAKIHDGLENGKRMVMVLSPEYLTSKYTKAEWTAAFANAPAMIWLRLWA